MVEFLPSLNDKPVYLKFIVLVLLIAISMVLTMVLGLVIALPFFGIGILESFTNSVNYNSLQAINFLKYFQVVNQIGVFILPVIGFAYLESRNTASYLKLNCRPGGSLLMFSILLILVSIPAVNWMVHINEKMHLPEFLRSVEKWMRDSEDGLDELTEAFLKTNSIAGLIANLFVVGFLAAIGEEFLFRGVVQKLLFEWSKNIHIAVIASAIIFSAFHMQFFGFLPRMFLGVLLGYCFIISGSLWIPIIVHFIFNAISVTEVFLIERGFISSEVENIEAMDNPLIIAGSFMVSLIFLIILFRKSPKPFESLQS